MWPGTESNCRHEDFQSSALPTELPGQKFGILLKRLSESRLRTRFPHRFRARFNEVQDLDLEPDTIERIDFLHARGTRDIHFREKIPDHVQAREKKAVLPQQGRQRLTNFPVSRGDLGADALRADMDVAA